MTINDKVARLIRPEIQQSRAYAVANSAGRVKLDAMENPYPWPPHVIETWLKVLRDVAVNRYPDPDPRALKERLRAALAVPEGMGLILGNGSDELIQIVLLALARPGSHVLAPTPTFVMYEVSARNAGMKFIGTPLCADFTLDTAAMLAAIERHSPAVAFIAYPNNPTANLFAAADVETIIRTASGLVVIDEAYFAFSNASFLQRLAEYDNLLILRTLSKLGLAGLRLGLLIGAPAWLAQFNKVRLPYNVNSLTQASVEFALANRDFLDRQVAQIRADREQLYAALEHLPGIHPWPSQTNFILFRVQAGNATRVYEALYGAGVVVKNLDKTDAALRDCLRVTVGTAEENALFLDALQAASR